MSPIENAAREIVNTNQGCDCDDCKRVVADIIRRHLFPVVKFEDVVGSEMYYVRYTGNPNWDLLRGRFLVSDDEIRGPIQHPE